MNLGNEPFQFGPDDVTLSLSDGTVLKPVPVALMEDGRELVEREMQHYYADDIRTRNNLSGLAQQTNGAATVQSMSSGAATPGSAVSGVGGQDHRVDESTLPGAKLLESIYQVLIPLNVEPQKAWGGYYLFDMPKAVFQKKAADQPLTITVRTGAEEHRFAATLKWK